MITGDYEGYWITGCFVRDVQGGMVHHELNWLDGFKVILRS